jgi:hypothetical protein
MRHSSCSGWRRQTVLAACLVFVALGTAPAAFSAVPAAPAVSVSAGLKQLHFAWSRVAGATRYELWFRANTGAAWVEYAQLPGTRSSLAVNISAHLLHWQNARYLLKACNADGCRSSAPLAVSHLMQRTVGYFAIPATSNRHDLGWDVELGEWGTTLAAAFRKDETDSAGVAVFRKTTGAWHYEAQLLADPREQDLIEQADPSVTASANGDVIALGVDVETRPGADVENGASTGAVYVFRRTAAGWVREQKLEFPDSLPGDRFGRHVELDESGTLLAAWRRFGDQPGQPPGPWAHQGFVELFRYAGGTWARHVTIPALNTSCETMGLSGDGRTLVRSCGDAVEVFTAPTWQRVAILPNEIYSLSEYAPDPRAVAVSFDGRSFAVRSVTLDEDLSTVRAWVNVYRLGASGWARDASLAPGEWTDPGPPEDPHQGFGLSIAMSRDGRFVAVGASSDYSAGSGAVYPPYARGSGPPYGAVYVYEHKVGGWRLRQFIRPNENADTYEAGAALGRSLSFARNGKDLATGGDGAPGAATVIGAPASGPYRGAVWLY